MSTMTPVSDDDPLMIAWKAYQATDEFANSQRWVQHVAHPHLQGALWAVFMAGFIAGKSTRLPPEGSGDQPKDGETG